MLIYCCRVGALGVSVCRFGVSCVRVGLCALDSSLFNLCESFWFAIASEVNSCTGWPECWSFAKGIVVGSTFKMLPF